MFCAQCGKQLPEGAKFCPECGYRLTAQNLILRDKKENAQGNSGDSPALKRLKIGHLILVASFLIAAVILLSSANLLWWLLIGLLPSPIWIYLCISAAKSAKDLKEKQAEAFTTYAKKMSIVTNGSITIWLVALLIKLFV